MGDGTNPENAEDQERNKRDEDRKLEGDLDAPDVEADKDRIGNQLPDRSNDINSEKIVKDGAHIAADPDHDHRRGQHVFHGLGQAGDEAAPRPHSCTAEGVGATRV